MVRTTTIGYGFAGVGERVSATFWVDKQGVLPFTLEAI
jgi:hypothetical protein